MDWTLATREATAGFASGFLLESIYVPSSRLWDQVCKRDNCLFLLVSVQCRAPMCRVHAGKIIGISQQSHKIIPYCFWHGVHNQRHIAKLPGF